MERVNVLIADDDKIFSELTRFVLEEHDFDVVHAQDLGTTMSFINLKRIDVVILDLHFPRYEDGITALKEIKSKFPHIPVIMVTSEYIDIVGKVVEAIKCGAYDFVEKPIKEERLIITINNALEVANLKSSLSSSKNKSLDLIGNSQKMAHTFDLIKEAAKNDEPTLIVGEAGIGKKVIAKTIHKLSDRSENDSIYINCATINKDYFEHEFLGLKNVTSSGQSNEYYGNLELAHNTSLIIDNIDLVPINLQDKLVDYINTKSFKKIGGNKEIRADVKIIATTSKDLSDMKNFSKALYDLFTNSIKIPPLRERKEDIVPLINFLVKVVNDINHTNFSFSESFLKMLENYEWLGNIRELQTKIIYLLINANNEIITEDQFDFNLILNDHLFEMPFKNAMKELEKDYLINLLNRNNWNVADSASKIGIDRTNLFKKMKNHNIKPKKKTNSR